MFNKFPLLCKVKNKFWCIFLIKWQVGLSNLRRRYILSSMKDLSFLTIVNMKIILFRACSAIPLLFICPSGYLKVICVLINQILRNHIYSILSRSDITWLQLLNLLVVSWCKPCKLGSRSFNLKQICSISVGSLLLLQYSLHL